MTIAQTFARARASGRAALIPYVMAGDPALERTPGLIAALVDGGADVIELGIPYSDPLADGPTIQAAAQRALAAGATMDKVLAMMERITRAAAGVPVVAFTYYNPLFVRGLARAAVDLARAGFAGAIVPDLPLEEAAPATDAFASTGVGLTLLVSPTTPLPRARRIAAASSGFVYVVSRTGVTGAGESLSDIARHLVHDMRTVTEKPLAVGFGISTPAHAAEVGRYADGVVVGSALIESIVRARPGGEEAAARDFCSSLAAALRVGGNGSREGARSS